MISSVSNAAHVQAVAPAVAQPASAPKPTAQAQPQAAPRDTVQISAAAQAIKEAIENPAQTAKEAAGGDAQARRLLAKEAADKIG